MKRILTIFAAFAAAATALNAQTANDAYIFSQNDYQGTARTVAMGNAFTALGGDIGSVNINPAALAVATYGQYTITPGINLAVNSAQGTTLAGDTGPFCFQNMNTNRSSKFVVPNIGVSMNLKTGRYSGLKSVAVGFTLNRTASYLDEMLVSGTNPHTSMMGSLAAGATGVVPESLDGIYAMAYNSGMISTYDTFNDEYIGTSEAYSVAGDGSVDIWQAGVLNQKYLRSISGSKYDCVVNLGLNFNDELYVGANFVAVTMDYGYSDIYRESSVNPYDFALDYGSAGATYFDSMKYSYSYDSSGAGIYAKIGVIWAPRSSGFRVGAAIQTPTIMTINESWYSRGETNYTDSRFNASADGPYGDGYTYNLISPFSLNVGAAYTFGKWGVASFDYELCDYSKMSFNTNNLFDKDYFFDINEDIRSTMGASHAFRAGVEFKPWQNLALRAGYSFVSSGQRTVDDFGRKSSVNSHRLSPSLGLGYASNGSFFCDLAWRMNRYEKEYVYPYDDYLSDMPSPEICNVKTLTNLLFTFGFRF